ncbi:GspE/PulE family protein [Chitinimonas sp. BJB300]|uniref:GspE/PulE family protein n=1 Tax=Chitinimonas sp. BJB300 TaxID=1559339 RepID=UPI000C112D3A|nr:GspE/PulE family protein [Chitinimonas sp. BJB300]PHV13526.1 general secretion pathway protein GspE [Chitinimonas sp. BJB300]TSJ89791.1 type II/IV secretion system protein [Chitinimonas sp. BJB300]
MNARVHSSESHPRLSQTTLARARETSETDGIPLLEALATESRTTREAMLSALSSTLRIPLVPSAKLADLNADFSRIPFAECQARLCLPIKHKDRMVAIVADPLQPGLLHWLEHKLDGAYQLALCDDRELTARFSELEEGRRAIDGLVPQAQGSRRGEPVEIITLAKIAEENSQAVKLVNSTLYDALKSGASDIHIESDNEGLVIKYRIDGILGPGNRVNGVELAEQTISRLKVMSELDIAERRVPQDGRFKALILDREVDFRVSIMPSIHGEDAVLRVLDKQAITSQMAGLSLESLGLDPATRAIVRELAAEPYGMLLVTGPTGSGKTTTLYAALSEINDGTDKIITIEDPVEYQLQGILQIPVNEKKGLTFSRGLRSVLRHDPDKIMVGEIRDPDTAQIAVQAALTGHLVLSTVHANSVFDVISRFLHMEVDPYSLVSALNGVLGQRLVRRNCPHCTAPSQPSAELLAASHIRPDMLKHFNFQAGTGCARCRNSGYLGRIAIAEVLRLNDQLRELILRRAPMSELKQAARQYGTRPLREVALAAVARGETTLQEINRVSFVR